MRKVFPGHFSQSDEVVESIWKECFFVFDANILLNLYRYSDETRTIFIQVLQSLGDKVWIPYRVAEEFFNNRASVIFDQQEEYEKSISEINKIKNKLENSRQHPFVSKEVMSEMTSSLDRAIEELSGNKEIHSKRIVSDDIKELIANIFEGKVGDEVGVEELHELLKEGEERYKQKIPPGYTDIKKQSDDTSLSSLCRPYGDFLIWKEIIKKSKASGRPIVFVTDDGKEDWWLRFKGKTISPRPELIREFCNQTNSGFCMYHPERFLSLASNNIKKNAPKEVLDEIRDVRNKDSLEVGGSKSKYPHIELPWEEVKSFDVEKYEAYQNYIMERNFSPEVNEELSQNEENGSYLRSRIDELSDVQQRLRAERNNLMTLRRKLIFSGSGLDDKRKDDVRELASQINSLEHAIREAKEDQTVLFHELNRLSARF